MDRSFWSWHRCNGHRQRQEIHQSQVAATIASLLRLDFKAHDPRIAQALPIIAQGHDNRLT
ncbi:MAG: hypothetical protein KF752_00620 [Pirellulaceae bacterium]|nr:hypothetical protein [Pirellulaceae bacterium]